MADRGPPRHLGFQRRSGGIDGALHRLRPGHADRALAVVERERRRACHRVQRRPGTPGGSGRARAPHDPAARRCRDRELAPVAAVGASGRATPGRRAPAGRPRPRRSAQRLRRAVLPRSATPGGRRLCGPDGQSPRQRQLRRSVRAGRRPRLGRRGPRRHPGRARCRAGASEPSHRSGSPGHHGRQLRRLHDLPRDHPDGPIRGRDRQRAAEQHRKRLWHLGHRADLAARGIRRDADGRVCRLSRAFGPGRGRARPHASAAAPR